MTKYLLAAAAVAAIAISGAAFAEDGKATSTAPKAMSDSEMDKVTAGDGSGTLGAPGEPKHLGLGNVETKSQGAGERISAGVGNGTASSAGKP